MLKGGTAGQQQNTDGGVSQFGSFTRAGVKTVYASPKKVLDVRILPAFDPELSVNDKAYKESFTSYRDSNSDAVDPDTKTEPFTAWFYVVEGHTYFGLQKKQFLSPLTGTQYFPAGHDPVRDAWKYIDEKVPDGPLKTLAYGLSTKDLKTGKPRTIQSYLSKTPRRFALMNILVENEQKRGVWENAVLITPITTLNDLKVQLSQQTKRSDTVIITPEWEDYYYGDITHPEHGCVARLTEKFVTGTTGNQIRTTGFYLDQKTDSPETHNMLQRPVSVAELQGRYDISDTENVTNLPDKSEQYQIILNYLVEDGVVPLAILEAACGQFGKINSKLRTRNHAAYEGEAPVANDAGESVEISSKPATPRAASNPTIKHPVQTATPVEAAAVGSLKPPTQRSAPPEDDENDDIPMGDTPETDENSGSGLSPEEQARFDELNQKMDNEALSPDELVEFSTLCSKQA